MVEAIKAEIEGMKAENSNREDKGFAQAYPDSAFFECSTRIELLAKTIEMFQ
jgi:hypothetical protein